MITDYQVVGDVGGISIHKTTIQGKFQYVCGCGHIVEVKAASKRKDDSSIRFDVVHRNRVAAYSSTDPDAHVLLEKIIRVCTYAKCEFPLV